MMHTIFAATIIDDMGDKALSFGVSWDKLIIQLVIFLILFLVLKKFAFAPILAVLDERKKRVEESIAAAERTQRQLAEAEKHRDELIRQAAEQAGKIIEEARASADSVGSKKIQEAAQQAESLLKKAQEAAERDRDKMMAELKGEIGNLVVDTVSKVTGKVLSDSDRQRLEKESLTGLSS
jgi:F-type H+-transporting ATPase subunit b